MPEHEYAVRVTRSEAACELFFGWQIVRKADGHVVARSSRTFSTRFEALADSARAAASLAFDVAEVESSEELEADARLGHRDRHEAFRRPDLTYFLYALDIAAEADSGFPREALALVESAWQFPGTMAATFGWVIALKNDRRLYIEMDVTYLPGEAPIKLEIKTLDPEETYPTLESARGKFWYRPDHINQHLGITGTSPH